LICLILIQRGKGGGLAGAFGGMGGSSAFGTKAGDVFTKVTIYVALFWGLLAMFLVFQSNRGTESAWGADAAASVSKSIDTKAKSGSDKAKGDADETAAPDSLPSTSPAAKDSAAPAVPGPLPPPSPASKESASPAPVGVDAIPDEKPPGKTK